MAADLIDLRAKVSAETNAVLEALSRAGGKDKSEIVREVLHLWALAKVDEATLIHRFMVGQGLPGIQQGGSGK